MEDINRLYGQHFESLNEYKEGRNFERVLEKLNIEDARDAVLRAERMMKEKETRTHGKYKYCETNPATNVDAMVRRILRTAGYGWRDVGNRGFSGYRALATVIFKWRNRLTRTGLQRQNRLYGLRCFS